MDGDKILKKLVEMDGKIDGLAKNQDRMAVKLVEMDEKMDNFVTNDEFGKFREEVAKRDDQMIVILKRLDEERVFTHKWVKEIEDEVKMIKLQLKIA